MFLSCGEALYDFFMEAPPSGRDRNDALSFDARPGGSPLNVALGMARLGQSVGLLTGISDDLLGQRLTARLKAENVSTAYLIPTGRRTTLSLVGLTDHGQPAYTFYGVGSADCAFTTGDLPVVDSITGLHFGSYSVVTSPAAEALLALAQRHRNTFIALDPNVRLTVEPDLQRWHSCIAKYLPLANLVKTSTEDVIMLYPDSDPQDICQRWIDEHDVDCVVLTDGENPVRAWNRWQQGVSLRPEPAPESTGMGDRVGAGDSFQAALLSRMLVLSSGAPAAWIADIDAAALEDLLSFAARAARLTCMRRGADLPTTQDLDA